MSLASTRATRTLPAELPLTGLRITAVGADVAVRDPSGQWQADSGQLLMDFEGAPVAGSVSFTAAVAPPPPVDWFERGRALEAEDPAATEAAYRNAIGAEPTNAWPYLNLGALLCESGRHAQAVALFERADERVRQQPLVQFNLAIALEDAGRLPDAIAAYERALALDPAFAEPTTTSRSCSSGSRQPGRPAPFHRLSTPWSAGGELRMGGGDRTRARDNNHEATGEKSVKVFRTSSAARPDAARRPLDE